MMKEREHKTVTQKAREREPNQVLSSWLVHPLCLFVVVEKAQRKEEEVLIGCDEHTGASDY